MPKAKAAPKTAKLDEVNVSLSVDDACLDRFSAVVEDATAAGLRVDAALGGIGLVTGTIAEANVPELRRVKGIASVEGAREYQLAPPHSRVQ